MKTKFFVLLSIACALNLYAAEKKESPKDFPAVTPVEKYNPPQLSSQDSWTMVMIPDTQTYVKFARNQGAGDMVFSWIAENVNKLKIQQVVHVGDLVDQNRSMQIGKWGDQTSVQQWKSISDMFARLDGVVPYIVATGNHDYGGRASAADRVSELDKYFSMERNSKNINVLKNTGPNSLGHYTLENAAYEFITPNGQKILIVSLGFAPTDEQLEWAKSMFNHKFYKEHFGILVTHSYLDKNGRMEKENYPIGGNAGESIWQKLVKITPNIRMVLCGHAYLDDKWEHAVRYQVSKNDEGKKVHEILFNAQGIGGGWIGNGGDGFIRLMEFDKEMKHVKVRTFSPFFAYSPSTQHLAWHTAPFNEFDFNID